MIANNSQAVISIVPSLPPSVGGVGDYALQLALKLRLLLGVNTQFLVCEPDWNGDDYLEGFRVTKVKSRSAASLYEQLTPIHPKSPIFLNYVGYGYAERGCPTWLVNGLDRWRREHQLNLITMFHELSAFGPPWTSSFWLSSLQTRLVKQLVSMSTCLITSGQGYADTLRCWIQGDSSNLFVLPVFSSVGEIQSSTKLTSRNRQLIIFGGRNKRRPIYQKCQLQLQQACQQFSIQKIYDIGPSLTTVPSHISDVPIIPTGTLPNYIVSQYLSESIAGFFNYNLAYLSKSSIFSAYCSHGILPISAQGGQCLADNLIQGTHYVAPDDYKSTGSRLELMQCIANNAYAWYQAHNLSTQAKIYYDLFFNSNHLRI